jgi:tetratricopeptide (TPR) repeat protein
MKRHTILLNSFVAALTVFFIAAHGALAQTATLDELFSRLESADEGEAGRIEREIWLEWSKSGSPAMDLLLQRGRDAMEAGDIPAAIEHLTALIDHDPEFAEGWNARATAYFMAGEFGPSVDDIAHTLSLNPRHFGALAGLGMIFEQIEQPEKALEAYRAALAIHPHMPAVLESVKRLEIDIAGQDL